MTLDEVKQLVTQGESDTLEFKTSTGQLHAAFETVCAFLNSEGGTVLIGVSDKGKINGQEVSDKTRKDIARELSDIEPPAQTQISISYVSIDDNKYVIAIKVKVGNHVPYVFDGRPYHRLQSTSPRMPQHRYEQLIKQRGQLNHFWDEQPAIGYNIDDLDNEEIRRTIESGIREHRIAGELINYDIKKMLRHLELLDNEQVTNAAVVLYAKRMTTLYSHCLIRMTRYRGNDKLADFIDSKHFCGNAFQILSEANFFAMRHLPVASFFEPNKVQRIDKPALPVMALREALINAICHREYSERAASISFAIFNDRLEIWNNGELLPPLQLSDLRKQHESLPRNKKIAAVFRLGGWVEKAGVGTVRMIEECKELGVPTPKFEQYSGGLAVIFKFAEPIGISIKKNTLKNELSARQEVILAIIKKYKSATVQQILTKLENPPTERTIRNDLTHLKKLNLIDLKGKTHTSLWIVK